MSEQPGPLEDFAAVKEANVETSAPVPVVSSNDYSGCDEDMFTTVKAALDDWGLVYQVPERYKPHVAAVEFGMMGCHTDYRCIMSMDLKDQFFGVYYICPTRIRPHKRQEIALYFAGANYKIVTGHFDLDFNDGEVRFKQSICVKGTSLSQKMVKQMLGLSIKTMDKFFPGIMAIEFGGTTPEQALAQVAL